MRFRTDHWYSDDNRQPGDTWRIVWHGTGDLAGYAICCPTCRDVHVWTTASNCQPRDEKGKCRHYGNSSCWTWTGSAENNNLTARPSLHSDKTLGGCGWHGYLTNGELVPV